MTHSDVTAIVPPPGERSGDVHCGVHGRLAVWPGYVVCIHVLDEGAPVAHYYAPGLEEEGFGEAACAACAALQMTEVVDCRLVCLNCLFDAMTTGRVQS